jgi:hypothetical protein
MLVTIVLVVLGGADDKTRLVVVEFACVVSVEEVETEDGGVSTDEPAKPVLSIVKPELGGLGCTRGYTPGENFPVVFGEMFAGVTALAGEKGRKG